MPNTTNRVYLDNNGRLALTSDVLATYKKCPKFLRLGVCQVLSVGFKDTFRKQLAWGLKSLAAGLLARFAYGLGFRSYVICKACLEPPSDCLSPTQSPQLDVPTIPQIIPAPQC